MERQPLDPQQAAQPHRPVPSRFGLSSHDPQFDLDHDSQDGGVTYERQGDASHVPVDLRATQFSTNQGFFNAQDGDAQRDFSSQESQVNARRGGKKSSKATGASAVNTVSGAIQFVAANSL